MAEKEINILGAGISGLSCAIILQRNGYAVNVYEKKSGVGTRFNDDWQGIENFSEDINVLKQIESYGIDASFEYEPINSLYFHLGKKKKLLDMENSAYLVRRGKEKRSLDTDLLKQATNLGAKVHFNSRMDDNIHIDATGPKKRDILARGIIFSTKSVDSYHLAIGKEIAEGFYSYLLIRKGQGTIATVFGSKNSKNSNKFLENTIDQFSDYIDKKELLNGKKFGGYGNFEIKKNLRGENGALLIGEAGGFQDYFWGFGMRYAIQTSYLAARSIINNESYEELIKANIAPKMKRAIRNRVLFESFGKLSYPILYYSLTKSRHPLKILKTIY
ncbi:MAG: NAD(P)/FAD-dependent oxidoreductase [Proteobacteria bacterium]|nr:NAD(P)/FAD-dependent oxidoreductase [Pseudomonadota bacterium]